MLLFVILNVIQLYSLGLLSLMSSNNILFVIGPLRFLFFLSNSLLLDMSIKIFARDLFYILNRSVIVGFLVFHIDCQLSFPLVQNALQILLAKTFYLQSFLTHVLRFLDCNGSLHSLMLLNDSWKRMMDYIVFLFVFHLLF